MRCLIRTVDVVRHAGVSVGVWMYVCMHVYMDDSLSNPVLERYRGDCCCKGKGAGPPAPWTTPCDPLPCDPISGAEAPAGMLCTSLGGKWRLQIISLTASGEETAEMAA